jgi:hypothetical protein
MTGSEPKKTWTEIRAATGPLGNERSFSVSVDIKTSNVI